MLRGQITERCRMMLVDDADDDVILNQVPEASNDVVRRTRWSSSARMMSEKESESKMNSGRNSSMLREWCCNRESCRTSTQHTKFAMKCLRKE